MKKFFLLFTFSLFALLSFSACSKTDMPASSAVITAENPEMPVPKSITCDQLKTSQYRQACEDRLNTVAGQILAEEVMKTYDLNRCEELSYDKIDSCKVVLGETGLEGPLSLDQVEALDKALQPTYPELTPQQYAVMTEEEKQAIEPEYKKESCQALAPEQGLRVYCESQIAQKIQMKELTRLIRSDQTSDCKDFTDKKVKQECLDAFGLGEGVE